MFEKEAEEYCMHQSLLEDVRDNICKAFEDGAKFGYNKANEWHNLQKNPKDLPDDCLNIVNQDGEKVRYDYVNEVWRIDDANDYICDVPIAWCEIPTFKE